MKKLLTILTLLVASVTQGWADEYSTTIYPNHNVGSWNALQIDYSSITGIAANDKITVYIAKDSRTPNVQLQYISGSSWIGSGLTATAASDGESYEFTMTGTSAGYYTNNSSKLIVTGQNYTITKVTWTSGETTKTLFGDPLELYNLGGTSVAKYWFEDATVGDVLKATLNIPTPKVVFQYIDTDNNNSWTDLKDGESSTDIELTSQSEVSLTLTSEMLTNINKNSLIIKGVNYTIGKVTLKTSESDENPTTIYEGSTEENATEKAVVVGDWQNYVQIDKGKFSSASANCIVTIAVSGYTPQVQFCDNNWSSLGDATVSQDKTTATLAITSEILSKIQANDMKVKGINYKLEKVELVTTKTETTINDTQTTISSSSTLTIAGSEGKFDTASANDILKIYLSSVAESDAAIELKAPGGSWPNILTSTGLSSEQKVYRLTLTEEIIKLLQEYGLYICGNNFTCDKVTLISAATGSVVVDNYFDTNGKANLSKLTAQSNVTLTYDSNAKTAKITSTSGWTGVAISPFRTETVSGKELAITLSKGIQIKVAVGFSDGTSRMSIMDPDAASTETTYYFPLDDTKNISSIQIQPTAAQTDELTISNIQVNAAQTNAVFSEGKADLTKFVAISNDEYSFKSSTSDAYYRYTQKQTEATGIVLDIPSSENISGTNKQIKITFTEAKTAKVLYTINGTQNTKEMSEAATTVTFPLDGSNALTQIIIKGTATISGDGETIGISEVAIEDIATYEGTELTPEDGSNLIIGSWGKVNYAASQFNIENHVAKAGDKIVVYVKDVLADPAVALQEKGGSYHNIQGIANLTINDNKAEYTLDASAASFLKDNGMTVTGQNYTIDKVTLVSGEAASTAIDLIVSNFYDIVYDVVSNVQMKGKRIYFGNSSTTAASDNQELMVTFAAGASDAKVIVSYVDSKTSDAEATLESGATTVSVPLTSGKAIKKIEIRSTAADGTIKFTLSTIAIADAENPNEQDLSASINNNDSGVFTDGSVPYWKFLNAATGDKIKVYVSDVVSGSEYSLKGHGENGTSEDNGWTKLDGTGDQNALETSASKIDYTLTENSVAYVKAHGLYLKSETGSFKVSKIAIISETAIPTSEPVALNEGDTEPNASTVDETIIVSEQTVCDDWTNVVIEASKFANANVGDAIKIYLSNTSAETGISLCNTADSQWAGIADGLKGIAVGAGATKYVHVITEATLAILKASGMAIQAKKCTIEKVSLLTAKSSTPTAIFDSEGKADLSKLEKYGTNVTYTYSEGVGTIASASQWEGVYLNLENESPLVSGAELEVTMQENSNFGVYVVYTDNTATDGSADVSGSTESGKTVTLELNKEKKIKQIQIKSHAAETTTIKLTNITLKQTSSTNTEKTLTTAVTPEGSGSVKVQTVVGETVTDTEDTSFASGTVLKLTAIANSGYAFLKWMSGNTELAANSDKTLTVTMDEDKTITAVFVADESSDANAIWTGDAAISWDNDSYAGATFDTYSQDPAVSFSGLAKNDTIQIITSDVTEGAQYVLQYKVGDSWEWTNLVEIQNAVPDTIKYVVATSQIADLIAQRGLIISGIKYHIKKIRLMKAPVATTYTLTTSATNGSITVKIGDTETTDNEFEADTELTLTAKTTDDYELYKWQVNGQDTTLTATTMTVKMTADIAVNAVFKPKDTDAKAVWTGYETLTSSTYFDTYAVPVTKSNILSNVVAGDTIMVFPMNVEENANYQLQYKVGDNWEWTDLVATTTSVPDTIKYVVTSETATLIAQRGMVVKGDGYSIRKISVHSVPTTPVFNSDGKADLSKFSADAATYTYADGKGTLVTGEEDWKGISVSLPSDEYFQATKLTVKFAASAPAYVHVSYDGETGWKSGDTYDKSGTGTELVLPLDHSKKVSTIHIQLTEANTTAVLTEVSISNMCTLTVSAANGTVAVKNGETATTDTEFDYGTALTLTATPASSDYSFKQWVIGETTKTDNPYTFTITGDVEITATFTDERTEHVLTSTSATVGEWSGGDSFPASMFANAAVGDKIVVTISALPDADYHQIALQNTSGSGDNFGGTQEAAVGDYSFTLTSAALTDLQANGLLVTGYQFTYSKVAIWSEGKLVYTLTLNEASGGTYTVNDGSSDLSTGATFTEGTSLKLTATGTTSAFSKWTINETDVTDNPYTFTPTSDVEITATFTDERTEHVLTSTSATVGEWSGGDSFPASMFANAAVGDRIVVTISALPDADYHQIALQNTSGSGDNFGGTQEAAVGDYSFTLTSAALTDLQANGLKVTGYYYTYSKVALWSESNLGTVKYTLTLTTPTNGTVTIKKGETEVEAGTFDKDTELTLTATANEGYTFSKWLKDGEAAGTEATLTVTMDADVTIEAVFKGSKLNNEERRTLWESSTGEALTWSDMMVQPAEVGEIVEAGEILIVTTSAVDTSEGHYPKIELRDKDGKSLASIDPLVKGENRLSITSAMATKMAGGFKFQGESATLLKLELYKPTPITKLAEEDKKTLWENANGEVLSWNTISIDRAAEWGSVLEEDERFIISVKAKESGDNIWPTIQLQDLDGQKLASTATLLNDVKVPGDIVITLTAEMVEKLKNGFSITGDKATITKAVLYKPALPAKTVKILNDTETAITGDALVTVSAAKLANISAYDVLTVNFAINAEKAKLVIKCNGEKDGWDYIKEMEFSGNETLFALPLTESAVNLLKANGLGITGSGYTFKSVTIKTAGEVADDETEEDDISNANASENTKKVYNVLKDLYGKKIVSGVVANIDWNTTEAENVYEWTGKYPAMNVFDYINLHASKDVNSEGWLDYSDITPAKNWWQAGGIVGAMWHW